MTHSKLAVVFLTTNFGSVQNGPSIYAKYLWESFVDHPEIEFHLVAPELPFTHERLHASGRFRNSFRQYQTLQEKTLAIAGSIADSHSNPPIIHGNVLHSMTRFRDYHGPTIGQINDYDAANIFQNPFAVISSYGVRRFLSLVWRNRSEQRAARYLTRVVCNSEFTKSQALAAYPRLIEDRTCVIYKAVDVNDFSGSEDEKPHPYKLIGRRRVLFVGANWQRKGLDVAIRAIAELKSEFEDVVLIVAGGRSQAADRRIERLPDQIGVADRVQFLGPVDRTHLPALFHDCQVFTLPSRQEALGVAILEALAAGMPVVASAVGGIPEILSGSRYSSIVPADSSGALATKIRETLQSNSAKSCISDEGKAITARFSLKKMIKSLTGLYRDVVQEIK